MSRINKQSINESNINNYIDLFQYLLNNKNINKDMYYKYICFFKNIFTKFHQEFDKYKFNIINNIFIKSNSIIELNPNLDDLFLNNIYKYNFEDTYFLIPLWHHEIHFEYKNTNIIFICNPILPNNYYIDSDNNIHIIINNNINEISKLINIQINIYNITLYIPVNKLYIQEFQTYTFKNKGLSEINTTDIYNIYKKMDIIIDIYISFN